MDDDGMDGVCNGNELEQEQVGAMDEDQEQVSAMDDEGLQGVCNGIHGVHNPLIVEYDVNYIGVVVLIKCRYSNM